MKEHKQYETASAAPEAPRIAKVYWKDLPADAKVLEQANQYFVDGKLVYWHGHEAKQAQFWLGTHLSADAQPSAPPAKPAHTAETSVKWAQLAGELQNAVESRDGEIDNLRARLQEVANHSDFVCHFEQRYNEKLIEAEQWLLQRNETAAERDRLREQVKELLAALQVARRWMPNSRCPTSRECEAHAFIDAAIARVDSSSVALAKDEGRAS